MSETHIRFDGWLRADDRFEPLPGWETDRPLVHETGDERYRLVVTDADGERLVAVNPRTRTATTCAPGTGSQPGRTRLTGYFPLLEGARTLTLYADGEPIHAQPIAPQPPRVEITGFDRDGDEVELHWESERTSEGRLTHHVGLAAAGVVTPLAVGLEERQYAGSLAGRPGDEAARLLVVASDGLRSMTAETEPFPLSAPPPTLSIQRPAEGERLPADQPITLAAQLQDAHGRSTGPEGLTWFVDGEPVASETATTAVGPLSPGTHELRVTYGPTDHHGTGGHEPISRERTVTVRQRSKRQEWYREVMPDDRLPEIE